GDRFSSKSNFMGSEAQAPFAVGGECEASPDIGVRQVRKLVQYLCGAHAASKIVEDVGNSDASAADAGLSRSNARVNGDPLQVIHVFEINAQQRRQSRKSRILNPRVTT